MEIASACLEGLRTQMTGLKAQQLGAYLLANSGQKAQGEGMEEKAIKQRQEIIFQRQIPQNTPAPNTKVVEISKFWDWERLVLVLFWGMG